MRRIFMILLIISALGVTAAAAKKEKKNDPEIDYVALAALLVKDGLYDRAETVLHNVDITKKGTDLPRYYTLRGLVLLKKELFVEARDSFRQAIVAGQKEPVVHLYIAQASFGLKDWRGTLDAFTAAGTLADDLPALFSMRTQCHWMLGEKEKAWTVLTRGEQRFPGAADLTRQKFFYLLELGLYQSAVMEGERYLSKTPGGEQDLLLVGAALRQSRQYDKAILFLEKAHLLFPRSEPVMLELARSYLEMGQILTAAGLFERGAQEKPAFLGDAAELYRRAKKYYRAMHLNTLIPDRRERVKQKLAIYLETEQYELVVGMGSDLARVGLLDDDDIRYALAYALFRIGDLDGAEQHLSRIRRPDTFRRAAELRREMQRCKDEPLHCVN